MSIRDFKNLLIPAIKNFANVPIIEADQTGEMPEGPHATFKITSPYIKGVGQSHDVYEPMEQTLKVSRVDQFNRVLSFTTYDMDADASHDLAQQLHDWFEFYGYDYLDANNIVVADITAVQNRDAFVIDGYERRNGFDVTLRLTREMIQEIDYIENLDMFEPYPDVNFDVGIDSVYEFEDDGVIDREYETTVEAEKELIDTDQPQAKPGSMKVGENVIN